MYDWEKVMLFDTLLKQAQWNKIGLSGGGYWSINIWLQTQGDSLEDSIVKFHNEKAKEEQTK